MKFIPIFLLIAFLFPVYSFAQMIDARNVNIDPEKFLQDGYLDYSMSIYMSDPVINRFFKDDPEMLRDQLSRMGDVSIEFEKYVSRNFGVNDYYYDYSCFGEINEEDDYDEEGEYVKKEEAHFVSEGFSFYDKVSSRFGCECPTSSFGTMVKSNCLVLDENNKPYFNFILTEIRRTPVSYVFALTNDKGKKALFNTKLRKFISDWVDEIDYPVLNQFQFQANSLTELLTAIHQLWIGFKTIKRVKVSPNSNVEKNEIRVINTLGRSIINQNIFPNPFSGKNLIIRACQHYNNIGTGLKLFERDNLFGITNIEHDTILLNPVFASISEMDFEGNLMLADKYVIGSANRYSVYNFYNKSFFMHKSAFSNVERFDFPIVHYNNRAVKLDENPNWNEHYSVYSDGDYCYFRNNKTHNVIYIAKNQNGYHLFNMNGKLLLSDKDKITIKEAMEDLMIVKLKNKTLVVDCSGAVKLELPTPYELEFLNETFFLFARNDNAGGQIIGAFDLKTGKITKAEFENIAFEGLQVYGIKLGKKTKISD